MTNDQQTVSRIISEFQLRFNERNKTKIKFLKFCFVTRHRLYLKKLSRLWMQWYSKWRHQYYWASYAKWNISDQKQIETDRAWNLWRPSNNTMHMVAEWFERLWSTTSMGLLTMFPTIEFINNHTQRWKCCLESRLLPRKSCAIKMPPYHSGV